MMTPETKNETAAPVAQADDVLLLLAGLDGAPLSADDRRALAGFGPSQLERLIAGAYAPAPLASPPVPAPAAESCRLGRFELLDCPDLGAGGMGQVWKARRADRAEPVAVHVLPEERGRRLMG